jgi:hypothetical protein
MVHDETRRSGVRVLKISDKTAALVGFLLMFLTIGGLILSTGPDFGRNPELLSFSILLMVACGIGGAIIMFVFTRSLRKTPQFADHQQNAQNSEFQREDPFVLFAVSYRLC